MMNVHSGVESVLRGGGARGVLRFLGLGRDGHGFGPCRVVGVLLEGVEKRAFPFSFCWLTAVCGVIRRVFYPLSQAL
ncbi:MAG: hypothetical protein RI897_2643 [Verrucomicrobiota bacterium]|jgi:hypothetical protein